MTTGLYFELIIWTIVAFVLLYLLKTAIRKIRKRYLRILIFVIEVILSLYLGMQLIAFASRIVWNHEYPFAAMYVILISDILSEIVLFAVEMISKKKTDEKYRLIIEVVVTIAFLSYNIINMQTIKANHHEIKSTKLKNEYTLVFFSDLHYGSSQSKQTVDKALDEIKQLSPDYLLLGGDITDENTTKEEMEYIFSKIASLEIPTFYIYGNHDRQERGELIGGQKYSEKQLEDAIKTNGIRILYEEFENINDDLVIMGREDPSHPDSRKAVKDLPKTQSSRYFVVLDHTPYQNQEIVELKADLQLSGHTHAAQFFPIMTIYKILGLNVYGDYYIGDTHLYVSPGIGGWYLPLRSEAHCNYEVLKLRPE